MFMQGEGTKWGCGGVALRRAMSTIVSITDNNKLFVRVWHAIDSTRPTIQQFRTLYL